MTETEMIVALDPNGLRPLSIGMMGDAYVVASETCAFDVVGATYLREVEPGEMLIINDEGMKSERFSMNINRSICSMEYIYFSRPDSNIDGINVHSARKTSEKCLPRSPRLKRMSSQACLIPVFLQPSAMPRQRAFRTNSVSLKPLCRQNIYSAVPGSA